MDVTVRNKYWSVLSVLGLGLVIAGSLMHFFDAPSGKYVFGIGSALVIIYQLVLLFVSKETDKRKQRILRIGLMQSLILALGTYSMFDGTTLWMAAILIYALVTLFFSFRK